MIPSIKMFLFEDISFLHFEYFNNWLLLMLKYIFTKCLFTLESTLGFLKDITVDFSVP